MKKNNLITATIFFVCCLLSLLFGCTKTTPIENDVPRQYAFFLSIKDKATGKDYFGQHANYIKNNFRLLSCDKVSSFKPRIDSFSNNPNTISWGAVGVSCIYLDFGNGDIDTIRHVYYPTDNTLTYPAPEVISWSKVYFNDSLINTYDFIANPYLRDQLPNKNDREGAAWANNPIIITVPKK